MSKLKDTIPARYTSERGPEGLPCARDAGYVCAECEHYRVMSSDRGGDVIARLAGGDTEIGICECVPTEYNAAGQAFGRPTLVYPGHQCDDWRRCGS